MSEFSRFTSDGPQGAEPMGWTGGHDWEVYRDQSPKRADLYDEDVLVAVVTARSLIGLAWKMRRAQRRLGVMNTSALG